MKFLRNKLDQIRKPFEKGQKFEKYAPAINALDTFLYVPNHTTKHGAHIRDAVDLKRTMITVVLALIPALLFGIYNAGYQHFIQLNDGVYHVYGYILTRIVENITDDYCILCSRIRN